MLQQGLPATDPEERQGDDGGGVENVYSLHASHSPPGRAVAQVSSVPVCILAGTLAATTGDAAASHMGPGMARVMVMLPRAIIEQMEQTREETGIRVSTQCRVLIVKALRSGQAVA